MQYRKFGKLDWKVSVLGFGAMRFPVINGEQTNIDEAQATQMVRYALDHGVNYIDSAYRYHNGKSEVVVGKALQDGYRAKTKIATKIPPAMIDSEETFNRILNEQLQRWQTDKIDIYLFHGMNKTNLAKIREVNAFKMAEKAMARGLINYLGFSFHDKLEVFKDVIDSYDNWTMCQIQYNFMDENFQAGTEGMKYAAGKGIAVVVMEPLRGGKLSRRPPEAVAKVWENAPVQRSPIEWAFRWVWSHPEMAVALSGMSSMKHVLQNVEIAERAGNDTLNDAELELIGRARDAYRSLTPVNCTSCRYCMPCPNGVEIPRIFEMYNEAVVYNFPQQSRMFYRSGGGWGLKEEQRADKCQECMQCIDQCPQKLEIPELLKKAHEYLMADK